MKFLKKLNLKPMVMVKTAGLIFVAVLAVIFLFSLASGTFRSMSPQAPFSEKQMMFGSKGGVPEGGFMDQASNMMFDSVESVGLSMRNVTSNIIPPRDNVVVGDDAEDFEVTEYHATIESGNLDDTCSLINDLKDKDYIIFESANKYDNRSCYYRFKVQSDNVEEVLAVIEDLDPKELSKNSYTIKRVVDDYTNEIEVLEKKMESIEDTLSLAVNAYDEITKLATQTKDVESLAKIIDSKVRIIERLTQEKIRINEQLDRLSRSKSDQLDRLDYTYFNVNVREDKYINVDDLKDSWKVAVKNFVVNINKSIQAMTINLAAVIFLIVQYVIYIFILLIVVKYGWKMAKYIWQK